MSRLDDARPAPSAGAAKHVTQSVTVTVCAILVGLVSGILAARALGVSGRGQLAAVILWPAVMTSLAELGLPTAFTYLTASRGGTARDLARSIVPLVALQSAALYAVGTPIILIVLNEYSESVRATAVGFLLVYAPLYLSVRYLMALNQGAGRIAVFNAARLLIPTLNTAALVGLVAVGMVSVRSFAAAYASSWIVGLAALLIMSTRDVRGGVLSPRVDRVTSRKAWSVGYRTYVGSLAPIDTLQLDVLLTTSLLGATEAGLYYVATSAAGLVRMWGTTFGALSLPRVAAAASREEALAWVALFSRVTVVCSGLVALIAVVFAGPLLALVYGDDFTPAATLVRVLAVGMLAASLRYVLGDGLRGLGRHAAATKAEITGWVAGGFALVVLLPLWGATGVAVAVSVSYGATLFTMLQFSQKIGMGIRGLLVPTRADFAKARSVVVAALHSGDR